MAIVTISAEQYATERAICDKAQAYWEANASYARNGASSMSAELAAHPDYAACNNEMRGRVEQYQILHDLPERLTAYVGKANEGTDMPRGSGRGATYPITVWTGQPIGYATKGASWRVRSYVGSHMATFYARIGGREYVGRGFGEGCYIKLRETAASKRARKGSK